MALTERAAAERLNVFRIHGTHWIPSEQIACRRVRTASGSDRIICHFPFSIFHLLIVGHGAMTNESSKWPMVNGKEK